ncbi:hypothetical protein GCM10009821_26430 [Aeromicrobium halocynthiae]|uniref:Uncharacterized protein n=1 Tax=Aeromicrobium halocynthiae TaxID=560557 RepID=A0ABP5HPU4_9ACTN
MIEDLAQRFSKEGTMRVELEKSERDSLTEQITRDPAGSSSFLPPPTRCQAPDCSRRWQRFVDVPAL